MQKFLAKINTHSISSHLLIVIIFLLFIPFLVMLYDLYFAARSEDAMLRGHEEKLKSAVDSVIIPQMENYIEINSTSNINQLSKEQKSTLLEKAFGNATAHLVASNPGVRFGLYIPENKQIFIKGFLHQYRNLNPEEQKKREQRILREAKSGLVAVAASGKPLSRLTSSLNDETYEYLAPLYVNGNLVAVVWADERLHPIFAQSRRFLTLIKYAAIFGLFIGAIGSLIIIHELTSGVNTIKNGLKNMQKNIHHKIPEIKGEIGEIARAINKMARSVAEKEKLEEELRRSERLAALGRLVAGVAHELRNPIGIVKTITQLMEQELRNVPAALEYSKVIKEQVERQNRVIKELLDFGRPSKPIIEPVSINSLLEKVLTFTEPMLRQHNITLELSLASELPQVRVDGEQIKQVFVNLILNAVQAMPESGKLTIKTFSEKGYVCTAFNDTGKGIPPSEIKNIFDPFYTTKDTGTGLGLSISHQIVNLNKGIIEVESSSKGSTFTVKLPIPKEGKENKNDSQNPDHR